MKEVRLDLPDLGMNHRDSRDCWRRHRVLRMVEIAQPLNPA
jgi:hypothetical protein